MSSLQLLLFFLATARSAPLPHQDGLTTSTEVDLPIKTIEENSYIKKLLSSFENAMSQIKKHVPEGDYKNIKCDFIVSKHNESDGFIFKYLKGKIYPGRTPVYSDKRGKNLGPGKYMEIHFINNDEPNHENKLVIRLPGNTLSSDSTKPDNNISSSLHYEENISGIVGNGPYKSEKMNESNNATQSIYNERYNSFTTNPAKLNTVSNEITTNDSPKDEITYEEKVLERSADSSIYSIQHEITTQSSITKNDFFSTHNSHDPEFFSETFTDKIDPVTYQFLSNIYATGSTIYAIAPTNSDTNSNSDKTSLHDSVEPITTYSDTGTTSMNIYQNSEQASEKRITNTGTKGSLSSTASYTEDLKKYLIDKTTRHIYTETELTTNFPMASDFKQEQTSETYKTFNQELEHSTGLPPSSFNDSDQDQLNKLNKSFNANSEEIPSISPSLLINDSREYTPALSHYSLNSERHDQLSEAFSTKSEDTSRLFSSSLNVDEDELSKTTEAFNTESEDTYSLFPSSLSKDNLDQQSKTTNTEPEDMHSFPSSSLSNVNQDLQNKATKSFNIETNDSTNSSTSFSGYDKVNNNGEMNKFSSIDNVTSTYSPILFIHNQDEVNDSFLHSEAKAVTNITTASALHSIKNNFTEWISMTEPISSWDNVIGQYTETTMINVTNIEESTIPTSLTNEKIDQISIKTTQSSEEDFSISETTEVLLHSSQDKITPSNSIQEYFTALQNSGTSSSLKEWMTPSSETYLAENTSKEVSGDLYANETNTDKSTYSQMTVTNGAINRSETKDQTERSVNTETINSLSESDKEYVGSTKRMDSFNPYQNVQTTMKNDEHPTSKLETVTVSSYEFTGKTESSHDSSSLIYTSNDPDADKNIIVYSQDLNHSQTLSTDQISKIQSDDYTTKNYTLLGPMIMTRKNKTMQPVIDKYYETTTKAYNVMSTLSGLESSPIENIVTIQDRTEHEPIMNETGISDYMDSNKFTVIANKQNISFSSLSEFQEETEVEENGQKPSFNNNVQTETFEELGNHISSTNRPNQHDTTSTTSVFFHSFVDDNSLNQNYENKGFTKASSVENFNNASLPIIHRKGKVLPMDHSIENISTIDIIPSEFLVTSHTGDVTTGIKINETYETNFARISTMPFDLATPSILQQYLSNPESKNVTNIKHFESTTESLKSTFKKIDEETPVKYTTTQSSTFTVNANLHSTNNVMSDKPTRGPRLLPTSQENKEKSINFTTSSILNTYQSTSALDPSDHNYTNNNNIGNNNNNEPNKESPLNIIKTTPHYSIESDFNNFTFYLPTTEHLTWFVPARISLRSINKIN